MDTHQIIHPHEVMVSVESSGKWPDDLLQYKSKNCILCSLGASRVNPLASKLARDGALDIAYLGMHFV